MLNARPSHHAPNQPQPGSGAEGSGANPNRLNLLSYAGWQHESWADRLPRLLEPMGVHSLRAGTGREATLAIDSFPIHMAIVDLSLPLDANPDPAGAPEAGPRLLEILRRLAEYLDLGCPILVGASRKSFLAPYDAPATEDRLAGTLATSVLAILGGASLLRVHDVRENRRVIHVTEAVLRADGHPSCREGRA